MKARVRTLLCCCWLLLIPATQAMAGNDGFPVVDPAQVEALQERMLNDPGTMVVIMTLLNDPVMQKLLNDPAVAAKLQAGDFTSLANDPRLAKLLTKPQVKEVEKRLR